MRHASGEWRWVVSRGTRVVDKNGRFLHFLGIARDITDHKHMEAEKERIEEKAQIAARLAAVKPAFRISLRVIIIPMNLFSLWCI